MTKRVRGGWVMLLAACWLAPGAAGQVVRLRGRFFLPQKQAAARIYDAAIEFARAAPLKDYRVIFGHDKKGGYEVTFGAKNVELAKVTPAGRSVIAGGMPGTAGRPVHRLILRRTEDVVAVIADGSLLCRAIDSTFRAGWVLVQAGPGAPLVAKTVVRRAAPVFFTDDFMVTQKEVDDEVDRGWRVQTGKWECQSIRPEDAAKVEAYYLRSANPFVYLGKPASHRTFALSVAGEEWWSEYSCRAAVKCLDAGAAGLAFGCESKDTFWLVRLECRSRFALPARLELVRVEGGTARVVCRRVVRARYGHWSVIGAEVGHGRVRVSFGGSVVMDVSDGRIVGGPIGLYAEGRKGAVFDDVEVAALARHRFDREADVAAPGCQVAGRWSVTRPRRDAPAEISARDGDALLLFGDPAWEGGAVTAEVRPRGTGAVGLAAGANGKLSYRLLLLPGAGMLVETNGGRRKVLERFKHTCRSGAWCKVGLNLSEPGVVSGYVGGGLVARVRVGGVPHGRVGLVAEQAAGARFRALVANRSPRLHAQHQIGNAIFLDDAYMSSWATERGQWIPDDGLDLARSMSGYTFTGKNVFWRKGDYYGDYVMSLPLTVRVEQPKQPGGTQPPPVHHPITGSLGLYFGLRSGELTGGYAVTAKATAPGVYDLVFAHRGKALKTVKALRLADTAHDVSIYSSGRYVWAKYGGRELFSHVKSGPDAGTRIAAVRDGAVDFDRLAVYAENLDDSSFERAPTGWSVIGDWQVTKRFRCDPRWSWMGIDSLRGHAALWRRREFPGDVTVEFYGSMKMRSGSPYYCPSDLNLTLAADREDPSRGYTFIIGGWENTRTVLLRNGKVVAETRERYLPDTRDSYPSSAMLHRRWFFVKVRRKGPKLSLYLDNKPYLEYVDPKPLTGGKVGAWTQEQSIMIARVLVYYSRSSLPSPLVAAPPDAPAEPVRPSPMTLSSKHRRPYFFDFETGVRGWDEAVPAGGALAERDRTCVGRRGGRASLKLSNAECSGRFVVRVPVGTVNLLRCPVLAFDYRIPPGVKVNLYFDVDRVGSVGGRTYFVTLTGPADSTEGVQCVGRFPGARADGRWRSTRLDVARCLRRLYPHERAIPAKNFRFAMDRRRHYSVSGIGGGNPRGVVYHLDNFLLVPAAVGDVTVQWKPHTGAHRGYAYGLTNRSDSDPGRRPTGSVPSVALKDPGRGLRFFHVRPVATGGKEPAPVARFPLYEVGRRLEVKRITPPARSRWGGGPIRIQLGADQALALEADSLSLTVAGRRLALSHPALSMDWDTSVLTLDPTRLDLRVEDGAVIDCSLSVRGFGQAEPTAASWQYVASVAHDKTPPGPAAVEGQYELDDFETDRGDWRTSGHAACGIDRATAAGGKGSLRIFSNGYGGHFQAYRNFQGMRIGECPVIEFDYKAGPHVRPDLVLYSSASYTTFKFLDRSANYRIGSIPDVVADGTWRHASLDIFNPFWNQKRYALSARLSWIGFGDYGWPSAREGDCYHIDNFRVVPVASCRDVLALKCSANDPLGVAGYACAWSESPRAEPPKKVTATGSLLRFTGLPEGRRYLHVRAVDRAGNWGPTTHYAFLIDNTPPVVTAKHISPRPGSRISPTRFGVTVRDAYGPDPSKLRLKVDNRVYTLRSASLYNARRPSIAWDLLRTPEDIVAIPNGKVLAFELSGIEDFAGNTVPAITGTWTMDYRRDRQAPQRVEFDLASAPAAFVKRFDRGLDGVGGWSHGKVEHVAARDTVSRCAALSSIHASTYAAVIRHSAFDLAKTGLLKVDVKLPRHTTYMDLLVLGRGFRCKLRMADAPPDAPAVGATDADRYQCLGAMNGARSGAGWHTQWVDLYALVKKAYPGLKSYRVTSLRMGRQCAPYSRNRTTYLDNLAVYGYGSGQMKLKLRSRDVTGLAGYAIGVVRDVKGVPAKKINHKGDAYGRTVGPGVWYVMALAQDNNRNWSGVPGVLPYVVKGK